MKKVKNYIAPDLAKKKLARYKYWSVKDENGITICSSEENNPDDKGFGEILDKIIEDNVDAEVQVKFGTSEQSSRQNAPFFIKVNEDIEWIEPEEDETVHVNGVPHRPDKRGNLNIQFAPPMHEEQPRIEKAEQVSWRDELEIQLSGIKQESKIKEERLMMEMHNKLQEQNLKFQEMLLNDRDARLTEREQAIAEAEAELEAKKKEIRDGVSAYVKEIPNALGGLVREFIKPKEIKESLGTTEPTPKKEAVHRNVSYDFEEEEEDEDFDEFDTDEEETKEPNQETEDHENIQSEAGDNSEERGGTTREVTSV